MKRRQDPIRGRDTDRCSATLVWRSSRAWHPHFRRVPPANASLRQQIEPASGTERQKAGLPEGSHHASRLGWEKIQIALHRVRNSLRMQGRNNEMSGFRSLQRRQRSFVIPDLTDKNDIRRLTKGAPQSDRKTAG